MSNEELCRLTIAELAPLIRTQRVSPVEVTEALLGRIDAHDEKYKAYITVLHDQALAIARERGQEIRRGEYRGPMHGIPIALKDLYETAGVRTTAGSRILADYVPAEDATAAANLRRAGAIVLGKTNLHEFAYGVTSENPHYGTPRNPHDLERITGGSSGGSGAAVGADLCIAATGSDTGGSIRIPAALCGIVGLKPTYGRISCKGLIPLSWSLDHPGPMCKSVADAAIVLSAMAGWDPLDPATLKAPVPDYTATLEQGVDDLTVAVDPDYALNEVAGEVSEAFRQALTQLEALGAGVMEVSLPRVVEGMCAALTILMSEATAYHEERLEARGEEFSEGVRLRLEKGLPIRGTDYGRAQRTAQWLRHDFEELFEKADIFATPMCAVTAPKIGQERTVVAGEEVDVMKPLTRFTRAFNLTGLPAITVPCGTSDEGLPIGLQLAGPWLEEAMVLRAAFAYEKVTA